MSSLIADERWYRVGPLKPYLLAGVDISPHEYRGEKWYVLRDPVNGDLHRIDRPAYEIVRRLDGSIDVSAIHDDLLEKLGEKAPTQPEVLQLLAELALAGLIQTDRAGDIEQLKWRRTLRRRKRLADQINPLSFKVAVFNLERVIHWLDPLGRVLFSRGSAITLGMLIMLAGLLTIINGADLSAAVDRLYSSPELLFMIWLAYPLMKVIHELAHALAARRYGARVTDIGVRLLVLTPVPYIDASMSALLSRKSERAIVAAAGIGAELVTAALATLLWLMIEPGGLRDFLLALILIGTVSTLLFNGNPLLRFDGYYVLTDLLELPNLARRSRQYLVNTLAIRILRSQRAVAMHTSPGERPWLLGYAIASWIYRGLLFASIAVLVAQIHRPAGVLTALIALVWLVFIPIGRGIVFLQASPTLAGRRAMTISLVGAYLFALCLVLAVPAPNSTVAQGVVWLPERAVIRASTSGSIDRMLATDGQFVQNGQPIVQLDNPDLLLAVKQQQAKVQALEVQYTSKVDAQASEANTLLPELEHARKALEQARDEQAALRLVAADEGRLVIPAERDRHQAWLDQGDIFGYVLGEQSRTVRVALTSDEALRLRADLGDIEVVLATTPERSWPARIAGEAPAAQRALPSAALGKAAGGRIAVDPTDPDGRQTLEPVFLLDLEIPGQAMAMAGSTALVRFDHPNRALIVQAGEALRRLFLRSFDS